MPSFWDTLGLAIEPHLNPAPISKPWTRLWRTDVLVLVLVCTVKRW